MTRSPSLLALGNRSLSVAEWVLCAFPVLGALVQVCVGFAERYAPVASVIMLAVLIPPVLILSVPSVCIRDRGMRWLLVIAVVFCLWNAGITLCRGNLQTHWWRVPERSSAIFAVLALCGGRASAVQRLRVMAVACSLTVIMAMSIDGWSAWGTPLWGTDAIGTFGFGHPNYLFNMIHPVMLAAAIHAYCRPAEWSKTERVWLVVGWAALVFGVYITKRRGVPVALFAGLGLCWWLSLWQSRRWAAYAMLALAAIVALGVGIYLYGHEVPAYRMGRLRLYQSALDTAIAGLPWGWGAYGATQITNTASEAARHLVATGGWAFHAHNEVLDVVLDSGPVGLTLWCIGGWLVLARARRIIDPILRTSFIVMLGAIAAHMATDPTFGQDCGQFYLAVMIGLVFSAPATASDGRWNPPLRWNIRVMAWPLAILATWGVSKAIYPAVIHRDAEAAVHIKCHAAAMHPQWACLAFRAVVVNPAVDNQTKRKIAAVQVRKVGWTMNNIPPQISYSDTTLPDEQLADLLRYIDKLPFERIGYRGLDLFLTQHPEFKPRVPPAIMTRLPYLRGDVGLIEPDLNAIPATMDEAIDCFSHIIWALERDVPIQRIATALQGLCRRYVDIPGVSLIAVEAGLESPDIFDFLIPFKENMKDCFIPRTVEILEEIKSPGQARKAMPLVRMLWSPVIDNMDAGRTTSNYMNPQSLDIYYALVRVWMLTRIKDDMYKATMPKTQPTAITPPASGETSRTLQAPIPAGTPEANNR